jgi:DNA polymerase-4
MSSDQLQRKIIHIDMDCYYAAVEMRDRPELKGKPVAIGGQPGRRSVLCTANYEARKFGVRSAMSSDIAVKKCPQLILLPPDFKKYKKESDIIKNIFREYTDKIEPLSLDEAYLDVTHNTAHNGSATLIAREIRQRIFETTGLTASAGIAPNKFLAKISSDWKKPNGQFTIAPHEVDNFVKTLPVSKIPGIGPVTTAKLKEHGIVFCSDIRNFPRDQLKRVFGKWGEQLLKYSYGQDHRVVAPKRIRKSFSIERTYLKDIKDYEQIRLKLTELTQMFFERLMDWKGKKKDDLPNPPQKLFIKVKFNDFKNSTSECICADQIESLWEGHGWSNELFDTLLHLLKTSLAKKDLPIRLLGVGVRFASDSSEKKENPNQLSLFQEVQLC